MQSLNIEIILVWKVNLVIHAFYLCIYLYLAVRIVIRNIDAFVVEGCVYLYSKNLLFLYFSL